MKIKFIGKFCTKAVSRSESRKHSPNIDVSEEYANAFRTESYNEFWARVLSLTQAEVESTSASRLPSYRLFAELLLDPDQPTVTKILNLTQPENCPEKHYSLLSDYFSKTADASLLCGLLLKDINQTRLLKTTLGSLQTIQSSPENHFPAIFESLTKFSNSLNPFATSSSSPNRFRSVQAECVGLLKQLELSQKKARAKLQLINGFKRGSAIVLVALATSLVVIVTTHTLVMLIAMPGFVIASLKKSALSMRLARASSQLDAAVKGMYILNRDLDTIGRLVSRLHDELDHMRAMIQFWLERRDDRLKPSPEVCRQIKKNDSSFSQQLDELEEHLYLCFMTINRARSLVMQEVLGV